MNVLLEDLRPWFNIIDIRDKSSYEEGHVYNSINIPVGKLLNNPSLYLDKEKKYYIYCSYGTRSKRTCELLRILGYDVVNVIDGFGK